jgi:leucyl aminopeptidase
VNEPQSFLNATEFSRAIYIDGKTSWIQSSGVEQSKIKQLKMGGLLAVNLGSIQATHFYHHGMEA